jgi:hypothetical protein
MGLLLVAFAVGLIIFGIGYLLGALFFKDFFGEKWKTVGGLVVGLGVTIAFFGVAIIGYFRMH